MATRLTPELRASVRKKVLPKNSSRARRVKLPLIHAKQKGRLHLTNAQIYDLLFQ